MSKTKTYKMKHPYLKSLTDKLGAWWWMPVSPYQCITNSEGNEAAMNLLWVFKGRPERIVQAHIDADCGLARTIVSDVVEGRTIEDWALLLSPKEFFGLVQRNADYFTEHKPISVWRKGLLGE